MYRIASQKRLSEKRTCKRIPASLDIHCTKVKCRGTITNLSAKGMFVESKDIDFPFESRFEISIPLKNDEVHVCVKVVRLTKSGSYYDGIGIELIDPPPQYLSLIKCLEGDLT